MMKIEILKSNLKPALDACCAVTDPKSSMPIAATVRVDASMGTVTLFATNMLQTIERSCRAVATDSAGSVMVDAKGLQTRIDAMDEGPVLIVETKAGIDVKQGTSKYAMQKFDDATPPAIERVEASGADIDAKAFAGMLKRLMPAMSANETSASTYAVSVHAEGGRMRGMATDGHLGAIASLTYDGEFDVLIPAPAVKHLRGVLEKVDGTVRFVIRGPRLYVMADGLTYSTLLAEGQFPALEKNTPAREGPSAKMGRAPALAALKAVGVIGPELDRVHVRGAPGGVMFRGTAKDGASASRTVDGTCEIQSSACLGYIVKMLEFHGGDDVEIWQKNDGVRKLDGFAGGLVTENDAGDIFIVMPLKFDAEDLMKEVPE